MTVHALTQFAPSFTDAVVRPGSCIGRALRDSLSPAWAGLRAGLFDRVEAVEPRFFSTDDLLSDIHVAVPPTTSNEFFCEISEGEFISRDYSVRASQAFEQYRTLEDGWDGSDALAPASESLNAVETFIYMLVSNVDTCPEVNPMLDDEGVPGIFWDTGRSYLSVSFYGYSELVCFYCNRETGEKELFSADLFASEEVVRVLELIESLQ